MQNISGFGVTMNFIASITFPVGLFLDQYADDADPIDFPDLTIADKSLALNGDLVFWSKPVTIDMTVSMIPGSFGDINLAILLEANRVGKGKTSARDVLQCVVNFPAGNFITLIDGAIISGPPASGISSAGRLKSKTYGFTFENRIGG